MRNAKPRSTPALAPWTDIAAPEREVAAAASAARADANLIGLLGLELLLLVFFVLLSGAGRIDAERAAPVMSSLRAAFAPPLAIAGDPHLVGGDLVGATRILQDRLGERIRTLLPLAQVETLGDAHRLAVTLPAGGFFAPGETTLSPLARERLAHIAVAIAESAAGLSYNLTIALAPAMPDVHARAAALGAAFARLLLRQAEPLAITADGAVPADRIRLLLSFGAEGAP